MKLRTVCTLVLATLVVTHLHEDDGYYEFEFSPDAENNTGEAEVRVDGSFGDAFRVEEEIEPIGEDEQENEDEDDGDLVAAARILTDYTYYAMVFDVIVHAERRGEGLGEELMAAVVTHPPLSGLDLSLLAREGLIPFYEACGFEPQGGIDHPDGEPEKLRFLAYRR